MTWKIINKYFLGTSPLVTPLRLCEQRSGERWSPQELCDDNKHSLVRGTKLKVQQSGHEGMGERLTSHVRGRETSEAHQADNGNVEIMHCGELVLMFEINREQYPMGLLIAIAKDERLMMMGVERYQTFALILLWSKML